MSVLVETSLGDVVIDLHVERSPAAASNFLKLCKIKYYNHALFHDVRPGQLVHTGDPTGTGKGGESVHGVLHGPSRRFFRDEFHQALRHARAGTVSMASSGPHTNGSQFFITVADGLRHLDDKYVVFGEVAEGMDVVQRISEAYADEAGRPYKNIRIRHTIVLDDPFPDPPGLVAPSRSPSPSAAALEQDRERLADDDGEFVGAGTTGTARPEETEEELAAKAAHSRAEVLEMLGDLPSADVRPPETALFVCKLNAITDEEALDIIFGRFGKIRACDVVRDWKTGESLNYAFIEYETEAACTEAYFKMDGALIDDRRIHVDFSQSVSKLWNSRRRGEAMPTYGEQGARGRGSGGRGAAGGGKKGAPRGGSGMGGTSFGKRPPLWHPPGPQRGDAAGGRGRGARGGYGSTPRLG